MEKTQHGRPDPDPEPDADATPRRPARTGALTAPAPQSDGGVAESIGVERVVLVSDSAFAKGGASGLVRQAARLLRDRGWRVTLLCGELGDEAADPLGPLAEAGIDVVCLGQSRLLAQGALQAARSGIWNAAAKRSLSSWIVANDTERTVYHLHGWAQILSPAAIAALAPVARRTVVHAHDFFLACPNGAYMDYPRGAVCRRVPMSGACLATQCDKRSAAQKGWRLMRQGVVRRHLLGARWGAVAMIHDAMAEPLRRGGLDPALLRVVRNPAEPFCDTRIRAEDNRRLAFVGRLAPEKGAADLARAAAELGMEVTFVGDGTEAERIRAHLPSARITGWQSRARIGAHLRDVRALVMPSRVPEPFGLVAAEASFSGLPVVLPDISLLGDDIVRQGLGIRYAFGDPSGLSGALAEMRDMADNDVRSMSQRGVAGQTIADGGLAQSEADWITGLLHLYGSVVGAAGQSRAA